ncbi:hypothetical protein [Chitinophaga flava]|uniref:DUF5017 domain-containing protein n=1 Tax=Chitinophaga flava TaxID=2259036 RepID=A0A365Y1V3_9BACT|nr:hypothetical protein [Chitinophaga flava]RBL92573.1 hypothetical protein DF182_08315 [Chitinophaga flava]
MKKIVYLSAYLLLVLTSCTKNNDFVKEELEKALPTVEVTSVGLLRQVGPFATTDVIQVTFGGALTKANPGALDYAWYDVPVSGAAKMVDSVHFNSWNESAAAANGNNSVATTLTPASYPNTNIYSGNINMKLSKLPAGSKSYSLRVYVRTEKGEMAMISQTRFITVK